MRRSAPQRSCGDELQFGGGDELITRGRRGKYLRAGGGEGGAGGGVESARKRRARAPETSAKVGYSAPMPPAALSGRGGAVARWWRGGGSGSRGSGGLGFCGGFWKSFGGVAVRLTGEQRHFEISSVLERRRGFASPIKLIDGPNQDSNPAHGIEN